jgi:electron transport complex protein RnfE
MSIATRIKNGILDENPTFMQVVGMCPVLAVTTSASNGIGMGLATTAVLTASNVVISLIRKLIPDQVRIPCFVVVIASFVTIVQFLMEGFLPALNDALGIFIPLIVVNCIILARAEAFACKNGPVESFFDGIGMGLGFTAALIIIGCVREFLGAGALFGVTFMPDAFPRTVIMILPPGAFITLGFLMAGINHLKKKAGGKKKGAQ